LSGISAGSDTDVSYATEGSRHFLILDWNDLRVALDDRRQTVICGSRPGVDLRVQRRFVSRRHARIERRRDAFVLIDESTNGTFVQTEDQRVAFVHRGEMRLWGEGWLSFGEPLAAPSVVRFRHA
jgi:hypothetical protein